MIGSHKKGRDVIFVQEIFFLAYAFFIREIWPLKSRAYQIDDR